MCNSIRAENHDLTITGVNINTAISRNKDGNIIVFYSFLHTGGFDKDTISVKIYCDQDDVSASGFNSGDGIETTDLSYSCLSNCLSENLNGSKVLSRIPLQAGDTYYCGIVSDNQEGTVIHEIGPVELITGDET